MKNKVRLKYIPHYIYEIVNKLIIVMYYTPNCFKLLWWGINFTADIKFDGLINIRKMPESKITIGKKCYFSNRSRHNMIGINHACVISTQSRTAEIKIGDNCGFSGTVVRAFKSISIGNNVKCGANTVITDGDWHDDDPRSSGPKEIIIGDNVWLGLNSVVLKGVTIGENTLVGANSVVTKSLPANVIAAGNPCRVIRNLE